MKVLKFGGKSLANGSALEGALKIIEKEAASSKIIVVCSARGASTDILEGLLEKAVRGEDYRSSLKEFFDYQREPSSLLDFSDEFSHIEKILEGVTLVGEYSVKAKDNFLSFGEILSCKTVAFLLKQRGNKSRFVDSRGLIKTTDEYGEAQVLMDISEENVREFFRDADPDTIEVVTGFIGTTLNNQTTTLGRNGSNYSATLLARFLEAEEVQNWTNVNGVYTANPGLVEDAQIIPALSYREANELANFGTNILHAKTILPLIEKNIPIRVLNSFEPSNPGTTINRDGAGDGMIKVISVINSVALVSLEGRGLLGKVGIDARIFSCLGAEGISVRIISQASSERGIGFIVDAENGPAARRALEHEFAEELRSHDISDISLDTEVSVISIIGRHADFLDKAYAALRKNAIIPYLINNTINGEHLSLVVARKDLKKAVNVIHNHVFGVLRKINLMIFGKGTVGGTLIDQIVSTQDRILERRKLRVNIIGIANSKRAILSRKGFGADWREVFEKQAQPYSVESFIEWVEANNLENVVVVDNTASKSFVETYPMFVDAGFDLIASNKVANTMSYEFYSGLRRKLRQKDKTFLYETNVGAGLPIIDPLKLLHQCGDKVRKIRGVFSGTLSYIFNNFSASDKTFYQVLREAMEKGYTEPDPREDLSGNDVARKLLILAREIDMTNEFEDIEIENLIPEPLRKGTVEDFLKGEKILNEYYGAKKAELKAGEVLRYIGELDSEKGTLEVKLVKVPKDSVLGSLKGSDSIFEFYTESYGDNPIVIQGAGAGAAVTARGVYTDILRMGDLI